MHPKIAKFLELEHKKAEMKRYWEELDKATEELVATVGLGFYFQCPVTGSIYKTIKPEGRFVEYKEVGYHRTKRGDEKRGDLSVKEAEEHGFTITK